MAGKRRSAKAPSRAKGKRIRLGKLGRRILLFGALIIGPVGYVWYLQQERPTQEKVEIRLLETMDFLREWERTPIEIVRVLDFVADYVPVSRGTVVDLSAFDGKNEYLFAGAPAGGSFTVLQNQGYLVGYDEVRRNPAWVAYRLFKVDATSAPERPEGFRPDPRTRARVVTGDYTNSGFDRGHLAPNFGIGLCYGAEAQEETFFMSNIAPQSPELNRGPWKDLEQRVARRISQRFEEVWILTGPIYREGSRPPTLTSGVAVPDAFYKIIVDETEDGVRALAFIYPQTISDGKGVHDYLTSIDAIETATGLDFFTALPPDVEATLEATVNRRAW